MDKSSKEMDKSSKEIDGLSMITFECYTQT